MNLASLSEKDRKQLLDQLSAITGLALGYDSENGNLQILGQVKSASGEAVGSATARSDIEAAVGAQKTYYGIGRNDSASVNMGKEVGVHIYLDFSDIARIDTGKNPSGTFNGGIIFIHELKHAQGLKDPSSFILRKFPDKRGDTVDHMNRIRKELGLPAREQYTTKTDDSGNFYIPFGAGPVYVPAKEAQ